MELRIIQPSGNEYEKMIALRVNTLLAPIDIPASYIDREKEKDDILIGAFENENMIGCCILTKHTNELLQLRQMAVDAAYQGRHIGVAIIQFAEKFSREKGYSVLMMHARDSVIDFYKKCGYQITGKQFFEVGIGHHRMEKNL